MRSIIFFFILINFSFFSPALSNGLGELESFDQWTGIYLTTDKQIVATVKKKLVQDGDLLSPPKYGYYLSLADKAFSNSIPSISEYLEQDSDETPYLSYYTDCDDPGCTNFDISLTFHKEAKFPAEFDMEYYWYRHADGEEESDEGAEEYKFTRAFQGIEQPLKNPEALQSKKLKKLIYKKLKPSLHTFRNPQILTPMKESEFIVYKKAFTKAGKLSALFINTKIKAKNKSENKIWPVLCSTILTKKSKWNVKHTDCEVLSN